MAKLFANSGDPDQMPHSAAASNLGLHCLPITLLQVSRLQWVKFSCFIVSGIHNWYSRVSFTTKSNWYTVLTQMTGVVTVGVVSALSWRLDVQSLAKSL